MTAIDWKTFPPPWLHSSLPIGMFVTDTNLAIRYWSPWLERHSGLAAPALVGRPLLEHFPDLVKRGLDRPFRSALAGAVVELPWHKYRYLLPFPSAAHPELPCMQQWVHVGPLTANGVVAGAICTIADLSELAARDRRATKSCAKRPSPAQSDQPEAGLNQVFVGVDHERDQVRERRMKRGRAERQ